MSFLNLLWIYIINEKWKQYKLSKTNKEQRREVMYKKLMTCLESVQKKIDFKPEVALILGSGLGDFADGIKIEQTLKDSQCLQSKDTKDVLYLVM